MSAAASQSADERPFGARTRSDATARDKHRGYLLPIALLLIGCPLLIAAAATSLSWIGTAFPGFLLMENRVIPSVSGYDWPPDKSELFHSQVIAIDGTGVGSAGEIYERVASRAAGTVYEYRLRKGESLSEVRLASRSFEIADYIQVYGILLVIALLNLILGSIVGFLRPGDRQARVFALLAFAGCLFAATPVFLHLPDHALTTTAYFITETAFPAIFIHFALVFPVDRLGDRDWRGARSALVGIYGFAIVLTAAKLWGFHSDPPQLTFLYVSYVFIAASFLVFLTSIGATLVGGSDVRTQLRARSLIPSATVGSALSIFAFLNNSVAGGDFPLQLGLVLVPFFYASVAYAIVAHDLFGVDRFIRQTFVYAILSLIMYAAFTVLVATMPTVARLSGLGAGAVTGAALVALAVLFDPLRRTAQRVVDRAYYRTPWNYRQTVMRVSREMTAWRSVDRIADELTRVLTEEMQLEFAALLLANDPRAWAREADIGVQQVDPRDIMERLETAPGAPGGFWYRDDLQRQLGPEFDALVAGKPVMAGLPLTFSERLTGLIVLGPPRSRRSLHDSDLDLIRTLTDQAAIALENARSYEALEAHNRKLDETVRERTAQLIQAEQLASLGQLVAGVAHELNNPVGAVLSSVDNLGASISELQQVVATFPDEDRWRTQQRAIEEILTDAGEMLELCHEGSERVGGIVRDLSTFGRADRGQRMEVDIAEGLESTLRLLADRLDSQAIRVARAFQPTAPIEVNPTQIAQVWMNILTNAIDACADRDGATVSVSVQDARDRRALVVEIRDDGKGMDESTSARIFEPFFTTKEIGAGTGLGMSIVHGIVRDHGGKISVDSSPEGGTRVRVSLPRAQSPDRSREAERQTAS